MATDETLLKVVNVSERKVGTVSELNQNNSMLLNLLNAPLETLNNFALDMDIDLKSSSSSNASYSIFSIMTSSNINTLLCMSRPIRQNARRRMVPIVMKMKVMDSNC